MNLKRKDMKAKMYSIIREIDSHYSELKKETVYQSKRRKDVERFIHQLAKLHTSRGEHVKRIDGGIELPSYNSTYYIVTTRQQ